MKILIVEDDRLTADLYSGLLAKCGHEVTVVLDGSDAFHVIHRQQFELIVLDIMLPHMDGLAMLGRIRAQPKFGELPILVVTSSTDRAVHRKAQVAGATEVIIKGTISPQELVARIDKFQSDISPGSAGPITEGRRTTVAPSEPGLLTLKMKEEPKPEKRARPAQPARPPWETSSGGLPPA